MTKYKIYPDSKKEVGGGQAVKFLLRILQQRILLNSTTASQRFVSLCAPVFSVSDKKQRGY